MSFKFHCECGQKVSATDDMIGTKAACPSCGRLIVVARPMDASPPTPAPAATPSMPATPDTPAGPRRAWVPVVAALMVWGILGVLASEQRVLDDFLKVMEKKLIFVIVGVGMAAGLLQAAAKVVSQYKPPMWEMVMVVLLTLGLDLLVAVPAAAVVEHQVKQRERAERQAAAAAGASRVGVMRYEVKSGLGFVATATGLGLLLRVLCWAGLLRDRSGACFGLGRSVLTLVVLVIGLASLAAMGAAVVWVLWKMAG